MLGDVAAPVERYPRARPLVIAIPPMQIPAASEGSLPNIPDDILTEPENSPDPLANLGPLRRLAGTWASDQGVDINPKADGPERRVFRGHITMEPVDSQANGPQLLYGLSYRIHINTPEEAITFHDQVGYCCGSRPRG